jgi:UDP-N-acetylglucosamine--N-acetylmuramyl-(pentapeptide) pyrophosphoryl-undecaprenol N-acetylglucosamine transferase
MFVAGGTGGHINPAIAVAKEVKRLDPSSEILFVGTEGRMETTIVPNAGFEIKTVQMNGFSRNMTFSGIIENVKTVILTIKAFIDARKILNEFNPDVVVGFGGYVTGPVLKMAVKMGIKTAIHEQNAFPGVANKALAKEVDKVMLTSADAEKHMKCKNPPIVTGLPVRREILKTDRDFARASMGLQSDDILVLSMGGSLGAEAINNAVVNMPSKLKDEQNIRFLHATGSYGKWVGDALKENGVEYGINTNIEIREYIDNMEICLPACDLVISRAGASSISEIQALKKPSILIPSPNVAENHQYKNAAVLEKANAAVMIEEKDLNQEKLFDSINILATDESKRLELEKNIKNFASEKAVEHIVKEAIDLIK